MIWCCWPASITRSPPRSPDGQVVAGYPVRTVDHGAWLGHSPRRQRRRGRRPASVAGSPPALPRLRSVACTQYESAGKRRDGSISREGSVALRRALIDLGIGLWRADPAARRYGQQLRARGKGRG